MVNFGDSLSDVGTYETQLVAANGGGHYSINGNLGATGLLHINWTEYLAATLQLTQPCAAETGLDVGAAPLASLSPMTFRRLPGTAPCLSYAQGGARVTNPVGPGNAAVHNARRHPAAPSAS